MNLEMKDIMGTGHYTGRAELLGLLVVVVVGTVVIGVLFAKLLGL